MNENAIIIAFIFSSPPLQQEYHWTSAVLPISLHSNEHRILLCGINSFSVSAVFRRQNLESIKRQITTSEDGTRAKKNNIFTMALDP